MKGCDAHGAEQSRRTCRPAAGSAVSTQPQPAAPWPADCALPILSSAEAQQLSRVPTPPREPLLGGVWEHGPSDGAWGLGWAPLVLSTLTSDREIRSTRGPGAATDCQVGPPVTYTDRGILCRAAGKSPSLRTQDSQTSRTVSCSHGQKPGWEASGPTLRMQMPQKLDTRTRLTLLSLRTRPHPPLLS